MLESGAFVLLPFVLALLLADSGNRSSKFAGSVKEDGISRRVGQQGYCGLGIRKGAGCILETAGAPRDLKSQSAVAHIGHEINAIATLHELNIQQTAVLEAKYATACQIREKEQIGTRTTAGWRPSRRI